MRSFLAAVQFLTIFSAPSRWSGSERDLARSVYFFPIVGLLLGASVAVLDYGLGLVFPRPLTSVFVVMALLWASGGLHIDGLADTADAFFSSRSRERMLEIMKDSRSGPMGVTAVVCVVALKIVAVASLPEAVRWQAILLIPLAGRCSMILMMALLPYVRSEGGLATVFVQDRSYTSAAWALAIFAIVGWASAAGMGVAAWAASIAFTLSFAVLASRKIGGFTGDVLGAACELAEVFPALVAVAWAARGTAIW